MYYDKIYFQISEKNEDKHQDNKNSKESKNKNEKNQDINPNKRMNFFSIFILDYKKNYMTSFQGIPMIFNKKEDQFDSVTLLSKNYDFFNEYKFI